jgi:hypothetical protein
MGTTVPNRLSVAHLLLWILGIGAMLAYYRDQFIAIREIADVPAWQSYFITIQRLGQSLAVGAGLAALMLVVYRAIRRIAGFPTAPGHWLLLVLGTLAATTIAVEAIVDLVSKWSGIDEYGLHGDEMWSLVSKLGLPASAAVAVAVIGRCASQNESPFWKVGLAFVAFEQVSAILGCGAFLSMYRFDAMADYRHWEFFAVYMRWLSLAVLLSVIVASAADFTRPGRDVLHWAGVAAWIGFISLNLAQAFLFQA